jgi:putative membrane protein
MRGQAMMMEWAWPMASAMWLLMFIFWVLVIVGIVIVIRRFAAPPRHPPEAGGREDSPLEILRRRYAAGEIDREQFARMKRELEN